jgi:excisionase family DNA binding protein
MSKKSVFDPKDLVPIRDLCADGTLRLHWRTCERLCHSGKLPAIKVGNSWHTTRDAVRAFFWKRGNAAFKELTQ